MKVKPKVETETALRGFPCKTIGDLIRRQNNLKLKCVFKHSAKQSNKTSSK